MAKHTGCCHGPTSVKNRGNALSWLSLKSERFARICSKHATDPSCCPSASTVRLTGSNVPSASPAAVAMLVLCVL